MQVETGAWTPTPAESVIASIAIAVQAVPLFAKPAKAVAIEIGAIWSAEPRIAAGEGVSGAPDAVFTPKDAAWSRIAQRSSCCAIATKTVLIERIVPWSTL